MARSAIMLLVYGGAPFAALANSFDAPLSEEYALSVQYPFHRALALAGLPSGELVYGLPRISVPFETNLYTFLGPGLWLGGLPGVAVYVCLVISVLVWADRRVRVSGHASDALLYGYLFVCIMIVSLIEPVFQYMFDSTIGKPLLLEVFDGTRLFMFSFVQLYILKRYDFISMYSFRLVYYLLWHILWGSIRLLILF